MENKNFLIAFLVFFIALLMYNQFYAMPKAKKAAAAQTVAAQTAPQQNTQQETAVSRPSETSAQNPKTQEQETLIPFKTKTADIVFTSKGAGIKTYVFKDIVKDVDLTPYAGESFYGTFTGVNFKETGRTDNSISFFAKSGNLEITKNYVFNDSGINNLTLSLKNTGKEAVTAEQFYFNFGPGLGTVESEKGDNGREMKAVYTKQEEGYKFLTLVNRGKEKPEDTVKDGGWVWAGLTNRYFLTVIIPKNWKSGILEYGKTVVDKVPSFFGLFGSTKVEGPVLKIDVPAVSLDAGAKITYESDFYFGPKDYKTFEKMPYQLDRSIDFGFFGALGKLIRWVLERLYKVTGNYGFAIILFAFLFQAVMIKLTIMQQKSSLVMKKLQPQMKEIQERYKDDKTAQQQAMMELYKKHNFNPFTGCLPLLIQLPIMIALFNAFRTSWDLHGAKFILWITDLSAKDPYYVLPIIMGAVMLYQQRLTMPVGGDPAQTAMLKWMPVIFTFVFINFPAGLVLYWLTNSILSLIIQIVITKRMATAS
ncbi:MAG: membrane protein insertase YidC [Elusimicrobium sp.]|jgi:YidC/Oxa1 family membrane protein insertase|nr:membrane protein insertase YidC [Elusimicrobium sp.]